MFPFGPRGRCLPTLTCPLFPHSGGLLNLSFRLITRSILASPLRSLRSNGLLSLSRCLSFWDAFFTIDLGDTIHCGEGSILARNSPFQADRHIVSNVISMDDHTSKGSSSTLSVRDRRYAIRYPFAADAELLDLESGARIVGVTSDISLGGCFVCTSKPMPLKTRLRAIFRYKEQVVEVLGAVRIVKPRIGMGIEFLDMESPYHEVLSRWIAHLQKSR